MNTRPHTSQLCDAVCMVCPCRMSCAELGCLHSQVMLSEALKVLLY